MNLAPWLFPAMLVAALVVFLAVRIKTKGGILPPHEFAYGTALQSSDELPERMNQFLSLEALDPGQIKIQTFAGNGSEKNLKPLIRYVSSRRNPDFRTLVAELKNVDQLPDQKEKAIQTVKTLLPYKDSLGNRRKQDSIIIFVHYGLKQPSQLSPLARGEISSLVRQFDKAAQADKVDSGKCPGNYLVGNINIYPLGLDNTFWHEAVECDLPKDAPILEIRFMGLRGIFRYLLDQMRTKTGASFAHLDGDSL